MLSDCSDNPFEDEYIDRRQSSSGAAMLSYLSDNPFEGEYIDRRQSSAIIWPDALLFTSMLNWIIAFFLPAAFYLSNPSSNVSSICNILFTMYTIFVIIFEFVWMNQNSL